MDEMALVGYIFKSSTLTTSDVHKLLKDCTEEDKKSIMELKNDANKVTVQTAVMHAVPIFCDIINYDIITYLAYKDKLNEYYREQIKEQLLTKETAHIKNRCDGSCAVSLWVVLNRGKTLKPLESLISKIKAKNPDVSVLESLTLSDVPCDEKVKESHYINMSQCVKEALEYIKADKPVIFVRTTSKDLAIYKKLNECCSISEGLPDSSNLKGVCINIISFLGFGDCYSSVDDYLFKLRTLAKSNPGITFVILIETSTAGYRLSMEVEKNAKDFKVYTDFENCVKYLI